MPFFKKAPKDNGITAVAGPDVNILNIQKAFDTRPDRRQAEHLRVIYSIGETKGEIRASISWEALAQLRQEMEHAGKTISERGVLDFVLLPWMIEQIRSSHGAMQSPPDDGYLLDFGPAPKPVEVRQTLIRFGLLPA